MMKQTIFRRMVPLMMASGLLMWFLRDPISVRGAASNALGLCAMSVIPALFPFLTVTGLLISLGFGEMAAPIFAPFMTPLFRQPGAAGSALILGFLGGYPVGARTAADLYRKGALTREEAQRLFTFCNQSNPAFLISVLGGNVFGDVRMGIWLLLIHVASAVVTGWLFRGRDCRRTDGRVLEHRGVVRREIPDAVSGRVDSSSGRTEVTSGRGDFSSDRTGLTSGRGDFFTAFVESVGNAAASMVRICGFVVFFYVLASPLREILPGHAGVIVTGMLELFSLTPLLTRDAFGWIAAAGLSAFGGLGVLCQTAAAISDSGLTVGHCAVGKLVQGILAAGFAAVLMVCGVIGFPG